MRVLIIDLERTAINIGTANIRLNDGIYLIVRYYRTTCSFDYKWGRNKLTRDGAILLLEQSNLP